MSTMLDAVTGDLGGLSVGPALRERRTAVDHVAEALRAAVLDGRLEAGTQLNQVELAEHFGVSRVPVREALRRLQAEGLVRAEPHRLVVVVGLSVARIAEIFDLRILLETSLVERAVGRHTRSDLVALRDLCREMEDTGDHEAWVAMNNRFHAALHAPAHAELTEELLAQLTARVQRFVGETGGVDRMRLANREHRRILTAVRKGDAVAAAGLLADHIRGTRSRVLEHLEGSQR